MHVITCRLSAEYVWCRREEGQREAGARRGRMREDGMAEDVEDSGKVRADRSP